jgi:hypothetical protein
MNPLPSVDDICAIAKNKAVEDAIMVAQNKIACLDDLSLEGDVPDNILDTEDDC